MLQRKNKRGKRNEVQRNHVPIGVTDAETDPFKAGRVPHPFAWCIYFGKNDYISLWESDSRRDFIERVVSALQRLPECILYAHNGGRFDFHYLLEFARPGSIQIRAGRVTQFRIGRVTLKDSFPLMPFALAEFRKTKIDYKIFERARRDKPKNREKIESYLLDDCVDLLELLTGFRAIVGEKDTIGSAAFSQMRSYGIKIESLNETHDDMFRPYFFGGRVEAFQKGIFDARLKQYDINSAYPDAMRHNHPHGSEYNHSSRLPRGNNLGPSFVHAVVDSFGALPVRQDNNTLSFPHVEGAEVFATGWEIAAGIRTRTLRIRKVIESWIPCSYISFRDYVDNFYALRDAARKSGDEVKRLAYKYLLNSGYGKFAQNPREFREYVLAPYGKAVRGYEWETDFGAVSLWSKPSYCGYGFFDVATGASITGFVRAKLWEAICASKGVIYCDTDAIICSTSKVATGDALGNWKFEGDITRAAIAGKKLYGIEWKDPKAHKGQRYKIASKGARLDWSDMLALCRGETITWENEAPTFAINGAHFIKREIRAT